MIKVAWDRMTRDNVLRAFSAYPLAMGVFGCLVAYLVYRFTFTHGVGLILLSAFDLLLIWLVWREYRVAKSPADRAA